MTSPFVHLHTHSEFSLLDGACQVAKLPKVVAELGQPAVALTDHGNLFGAIDFYRACKAEGLKPIIGYEAYVAPGDRTVKEPLPGVKDQGYHLVLLARNTDGFRNLLHLATTAYLDGFYYKPRIDKTVLAEHAEGLIIMTACLSGEVSRLMLGGRRDEARQVAEFYRDLVGPDHFFIEIQNHGIEDELRAMPLLAELADEIGVGIVATNDVHYLRADDSKAHDALLCISTGKVISDPNRMRYAEGEFHVKTGEEMQRRFANYPEALETTVRIAEMCDLKLHFGQRHAPVFEAPGGLSDVEYLRKLCDDGLTWRYGRVTKELRERMNRELEVIEGKKFSSYFLIVWDFVNYARRHNIPCGARGSAVGALVGYVLGFCDVDPLHYGLLFERFMDPSRNEMPDIDMDICQDGRAEILQYVRDKYGRQDVAQIITFGTMAARAVVRDVGRVLDIPLAEVDLIAKKIPAELKMTLDRALEVEPELRKMVDQDDRVRELIDIARRLEGMSRHASVHAAGVVIADAPLVRYCPLCKVGDDVTTQWTMNVVEKVGLLKMDFLGLKTLSILQRAVELVAAGGGPTIDLENLATDEAKVLELFARGETRCVFQFDSSGMRDMLQKMKPDRFEDLIAANALYRPGPMEMIDDYNSRKHGLTSYKFPHPVLHEVLDETYGIMAYQEQVMRILNLLGDIPLPRAYKLIKAISKKSRKIIAAEEEVFKGGCEQKKLPENLIHEIWDLITRFGGYGFNKSHSTRYARIAYQTAYMKTHHPVEFMAAQLTYDSVFTDKVVEDIDECRRMGIEVRPPDVNQSDSRFTVVEGTIRFGLAAVKGVGEKAVEAIIEARREGGPFTSLFDFAERVDLRQINRSVIDSLIKCGAFDSLGAARSQLAVVLDRALAQGNRAQADRRSGQASLFADAGEAGDLDRQVLPEIEEWLPNELLQMEKEVLGFFVSSSPLAEHERMLRIYANATTADLKQKGENALVRLGGMITGRRDRLTKRGSKMAIVTLQDFEGSVQCVLFDKDIAQYDHLLQEDQVLLVAGQVSRRWEEPSVRISAVYSIDEAREKLTAAVRVRLREQALQDETLQKLRAILAAHPGRVPVHVELTTPQNYRAVILAGGSFRIQPDASLLSDIENLLGEGHLVLVSRNGAGSGNGNNRRWRRNGDGNAKRSGNQRR